MAETATVEWTLDGSGWELDRVHFDRPVTAFTQSVYLEPIEPGSREGFAAWSLPMDHYRFEVVNGWAYGRIEPFGGEPPGLVSRFPALANLWRVDPRARRRVLGFDRFVRERGFERSLGRWDSEWRPEAERRVSRLRATEFTGFSDRELAERLNAWLEYLRWAWTFHLNIHVLCFYVRARFRDVCRDTLGLSDFEAYELLKRSDATLLRGSRMLGDIAGRVDGDDVVGEALQLPADQTVERLRGTWFEQALDEFLDSEGDRSGGFELADQTWREMPELVVGVVKGMRESGYDPIAEEKEFQRWRQDRVADLRSRLSGDQRAEFDVWLAYGERAYPLNESHNGLLVELPFAQARYVALEAARRLVDQGLLGTVDAVFHLRADEIAGVLRGESRPIEALVEERSRAHALAQTLRPPHAIGTPAPDPPYHALPAAVSRALQALLEQTEEMMGSPAPQARGSDIVGSPGSPGVAEGPVRVVRSIEEFDRVQPGDVLVCPLTNPAWTVLFTQIAGLVTEAGGALSHAAIVAREYGVPSVVGAPDATRQLADGQQVRIDGNTGVVSVSHAVGSLG